MSRTSSSQSVVGHPSLEFDGRTKRHNYRCCYMFFYSTPGSILRFSVTFGDSNIKLQTYKKLTAFKVSQPNENSHFWNYALPKTNITYITKIQLLLFASTNVSPLPASPVVLQNHKIKNKKITSVMHTSISFARDLYCLI